MSEAQQVTSDIDWTNDEAVVRRAVLNWRGAEPSYEPTTGNIIRYWFNGTYTESEIYGIGAGSVAAWKDARKHPTVVAFEAQHRTPEPQDESLRITEAGPNCEYCGWPPTRTPEGDTQAAMIPFPRPSERDWTEDSPHENGNYQCQCVTCKQSFIGHKRRVQCKLCAPKPVAPDSGKGDEPHSFLPKLGDRSHHFETDNVMEAIGGNASDYCLRMIKQRLHQMTSGERYTLYRAIKKLVLESAPEGKAKDFLDTPEVFDLLGTMNFRTGPLAHLYQELGIGPKTRCEDEQAFILLKFLRLARLHGPAWREEFGKEIKTVIDSVKAQRLAAETKKKES